MNEIEYAITNFEEFLEADIGQGDLHMCSAEIALAALREKAEREKGCEYCNSRFGIATHHINEAGLQAGTKRNAKHCPMCGKRLEEHHEAD